MNNTNESPAHGTEAEVCADIARRQRAGMSKYGQSVANNPLSLREWHQHAYEEAMDLAVYLKRILAFDAPEPVAEAPVTVHAMQERASAGERSFVAKTLETIREKEQPAKDPVTPITNLGGNGSKLVVEPDKAREWKDHFNGNRDSLLNSAKALLDLDAKGALVPHGIGGLARQLLISCAAQLEEAIRLRDEAVGHLRFCTSDGSFEDARDWLSLHFPEPAPEPAFDWAKLWQELPPWIMYVAASRDYGWSAYQKEPKYIDQQFCWQNQTAGYAFGVPPEFAPPAVADWKQSLVERTKA